MVIRTDRTRLVSGNGSNVDSPGDQRNDGRHQRHKEYRDDSRHRRVLPPTGTRVRRQRLASLVVPFLHVYVFFPLLPPSGPVRTVGCCGVNRTHVSIGVVGCCRVNRTHVTMGVVGCCRVNRTHVSMGVVGCCGVNRTHVSMGVVG